MSCISFVISALIIFISPPVTSYVTLKLLLWLALIAVLIVDLISPPSCLSPPVRLHTTRKMPPTLERSRIHCQTWRRFFYCRVSYCLDSCFLFWYTPFLPLLFLPFRLIRAHVPCATCSLTLFPVPAFRLFFLHYKLDLYLPDIFDYALHVFKLEVS